MNPQTPIERSAPPVENGLTQEGQRLVTLCQTTEPDWAEKFLQDFAHDPSLSLKFEAAKSLRMDLKGFHFSKLRIQMLHFGTSTTGKGVVPPSHWTFYYLFGGNLVLARSGTRFGPGDVFAGEPDKNWDAHLTAEARTLSVSVSKQEMTDACKALNGPDYSGKPNFCERAPAGSSAALAVLRVINRLAATPVYQQQTFDRLERSLKEAALFELLLAWPQQESSEWTPRIALPTSTRLARDFIEAHIGDLPTVADVAAASGVGVRALARGFEKHLGTSPLQYMLELRLQGVHDEMVVCSHSTVTDVALQWGFTHLGIFAARYRERFGELPSETLRKARC
jgi:AraC-like DNA-binding protein